MIRKTLANNITGIFNLLFYFQFRPEEAVWFSTALESAMGVLAFGVPTATSEENVF